MDIPYLSRKFVLSAALAALATLFMALRLLEPHQWQWVIMATIVSYVAANAVQNAQGTNTKEIWKTVKDANGIEREKLRQIVIWDRIKSLFDRVFLACVITIAVASVFLWKGIIPGSVWFVICSALAGAYNIGNAVGKS